MGCSSGKHKLVSDLKARPALSTLRMRVPSPLRTSAPISAVYEVKSTLGYGASASVRKAFHKKLHIEFAVKSFSKEREGFELASVYKELGILHSLDHPNVAKLYEVYEDARSFHFVLEYCSGGELFDRLSGQRKFSEAEAAYILHQLLYAVCYIHSKDVLHLDLKLENIVYESARTDSLVKIIDFGLALERGRGEGYKRDGVGTPAYMAPEVLDGKYTAKADVWSLGVMLYTLLASHQPFDGKTTNRLYNEIRKANPSLKTPETVNLSHEAKDLLRTMMCRDMNKRPSVREALQHSWFLLKLTGNPTIDVPLLDFTYLSDPLKFILAQTLWKIDKSNKTQIYQLFSSLDTGKEGTINVKSLHPPRDFTGETLSYSEFVVLCIDKSPLKSLGVLSTLSDELFNAPSTIQSCSIKEKITELGHSHCPTFPAASLSLQELQSLLI